jgi:tetratricopeptide (TPR) repeat protein
MNLGSNTGNAEPAPLQTSNETLRRALVAHSAGRLGEAEFYCRLVLAVNKKQFDAIHLLGLLAFQQGRLDEAVQLIRQALKINPKSVQSYSNLGLMLQQLDRPEEALINLNKALAIAPDNLLALNNQGHVLWRLKRSEEALASLDRALTLNPNYFDALCNKGNVLVDLKRFDDALTIYDKALAINPHDAPALNNSANVLWALNRRDEALQRYSRAQMLNPDDLSTLKDHGAALLYADRGEEALACYDHALALRPDDVYFVFKRGAALAKLDRFEEALACFDKALSAQPDLVEALDNRGTVLATLQRAAEAIASYDQALAIKPDTAESHWNRGLALLRIGDYDQGFKEYEWRWKTANFETKSRDFQQPLWLGDRPIDGRTILLHAEQGFGDTIQFARYVPLVAALGAKVVLEVQPHLAELFSGMEGDPVVIKKGAELPPFDYHCPLLSLPLACKTRMDTIPAKVPYISIDQRRAAAWRDRLPRSQSPRVGLVWAGNPQFPGDRSRSIGLPQLLPLLAVPGIEFVALQKDLRSGDEEILRSHPKVAYVGSEIEDFTDTAAVLSQLDLLISSDTSVVHLAGALGLSCWILLEYTPDWRWMLEREDNAWYPTARLFRQPNAGAWGSVVARVVDELGSPLMRGGPGTQS